MDHSLVFSKFSPLTTPVFEKARMKKKKIGSDEESGASETTRDLRRMAMSVSSMLEQAQDTPGLSSDEDLFQSQSKMKKSSPQKQSKSKVKTVSESESSISGTSSDTDAEELSPKKKQKAKEHKVQTKDKLSFSLNSTDKTNDIEEIKSPPKKKKSPKKHSKSAGSDSSHTLQRINVSNSDDDSAVSPSKKSRSVAGSSSQIAPDKLRYKIPEKFKIGDSGQHLTKSDLKRKQVWLIMAPREFDISALDQQQINLQGGSIYVSAKTERVEKQYEVYAKRYPSDYSYGYNCVAAKAEDPESFVIGNELCGQIRVLDWIPKMPPVQLVKTRPSRHTVPEHLKPCFSPFGSEMPEHYMDQEEKKDRHKKKKKKEKKTK